MSRFRTGGGLLLLGLMAGPALAYMVPADFVLRRAGEQWSDAGGLVLQREVTRPGVESPVSETVSLKGGQVRVDSAGQTWVYSAGTDQTGDPTHRPGIIDALFLLPQGRLAELVHQVGIDVDTMSLERLPTPDAPLPFRVLYRIGGEAPKAPRIDVEKDRWYIRGLQLRTSSDGPLWLAEYGGQGALKDLPAWLPTRIQVYRDGQLFESISVTRRLNTPIKEGAFKAAPRKSPSDER